MAALCTLRFWMVSRQVIHVPPKVEDLNCILTTRVHSLVLQVHSERHNSLETMN